jgi:hypothetical protein
MLRSVATCGTTCSRYSNSIECTFAKTVPNPEEPFILGACRLFGGASMRPRRGLPCYSIYPASRGAGSNRSTCSGSVHLNGIRIIGISRSLPASTRPRPRTWE